MVKIATMGDNVVDCYVLRGEMFPGGNCLNVSIFLRRSGVDSAYIGRIGKDPAARHESHETLHQRHAAPLFAVVLRQPFLP